MSRIYGTLLGLLQEAAEITAQNPDDSAQGYMRFTLTTGDVIAGRVELVTEDGYVMLAEREHTYGEADFPLFVRVDHIITFQYGTRR
ncbi:hypothetical protein SEA_HALLEY_202 [Mycobacterium phage Halley]|nr:hypothetical protein SEA_HALLEY_202 [Mycobacterium phage Halley]